MLHRKGNPLVEYEMVMFYKYFILSADAVFISDMLLDPFLDIFHKPLCVILSDPTRMKSFIPIHVPSDDSFFNIQVKAHKRR